MDFSDRDDDGDDDDELPGPPSVALSTQGVPAGGQFTPRPLATAVGFGNYSPAHRAAPPAPSPATTAKHGKGVVAGVRYRECLKNHAVGIGGHAVDGCGEFLPAGEVDGTADALRCAACGCHRSFHRKVSGDGGESSSSPPPAATDSPYQQFSPYYRTPAGGYLHHHQLLATAAHQYRPPPAPLALPSTSPAAQSEDLAPPMGAFLAAPPAPLPPPQALAAGSSSSSGKKRFRTKFTQEQKDKMLAFAERVGWRLQKHDEAAVQQFCQEVSIRRQVLKVWMHNNKHTLGKKP